MGVLKNLLSAIGLVTGVAASAPASATTIYLDDAHYVPTAGFGGISYAPLSLSFGGEAGRYSFTGRDTVTNATFSVLSYCLDFTKTLHGGEFLLAPISTFFQDATKQNQLASLLKATNALFLATSDLNEQQQIGTATAISVWEIVYEAGNTNYSVSTGDFQTFGDFNSVSARANSYLSSAVADLANNSNNLRTLFALDNQSQVFLVTGVPEPTNWAMMIFGFGIVGAAMRRRKVLTRATA